MGAFGPRCPGRINPLSAKPRARIPQSTSVAFDDIRELFAQSELARQRGLNASAFSFNSSQGQCERCRGAGFEKIEMQFLSDIFIRCPECNGRRYRPHILEIKLSPPVSEHAPRGTQPFLSFSIADLLDATVDEVVAFLQSFTDSKPAQRAAASVKLLQQVGSATSALANPSTRSQAAKSSA